MSTFSPRQKQILQRVAEGLTMKQIAAELGITEGCAKDHFDRAKDKIPIAKGARNRVVVVNWIHKNLGDSNGDGSEQVDRVRHRGKIPAAHKERRGHARCQT